MTDKELLEFYMLGFRDELDRVLTKVPKEFKKAYNLGGLHAIVGDSCRSVDYLSDEEILKQIKQ